MPEKSNVMLQRYRSRDIRSVRRDLMHLLHQHAELMLLGRGWALGGHPSSESILLGDRLVAGR
jgi:hypothetical protein